MTNLIDLSVEGFVKKVGSSDPAPGGGSVSALSATIGVALAKMVCELTIGKKKYQEHEALVAATLIEIAALEKHMLVGVDKDTEAFNNVAAVFDMPKETDADKAKRKEAMQAALKGATIVPYEMMELIYKVLEHIEKLVGKTNESAASDFGVAALTLDTGLKGSWLNVLINLDGITDEAFVHKHKETGEALLTKGEKIAKSIYTAVLKQLK